MKCWQVTATICQFTYHPCFDTQFLGQTTQQYFRAVAMSSREKRKAKSEIRYGNLHLLSFQKIYSLSGFSFNVSPWNGANAKWSFGVGCYLNGFRSGFDYLMPFLVNIQQKETRFLLLQLYFGNVFQQTRLSLKGKYARKFIFRTYRQPDFQGLSFLLQYVGIYVNCLFLWFGSIKF